MADVWGNAPIISHNGFRHYLLLIDVFSHFTQAFPLANKSDTLSTFIVLKKKIENLLSHKIKIFQSNNKGEFKKFTQYLENQGVFHRFSCPHILAQNSLAKRHHKHIVESGRLLLHHNLQYKMFLLIAYHPHNHVTNPLSRLYFIAHLITNHYEYLVVYVILIYDYIVHTNSPIIPSHMYLLGILVLTKGIYAFILLQIVYTYHIIWSLKKVISHILLNIRAWHTKQLDFPRPYQDTNFCPHLRSSSPTHQMLLCLYLYPPCPVLNLHLIQYLQPAHQTQILLLLPLSLLPLAYKHRPNIP